MNAIKVNGLNLSLGGLPILKDVSFSVDEGQVVALFGANGSGKTTLIKALLGLIRYQKGSIHLLGQPLSSFSAWNQLGYVPQRASVSLHSTTVSEVVASGTLANLPIGFYPTKQRRMVGDALDAVGLVKQAKGLYSHLSGGQQQRALIARAIVNHPSLLIMDEPFAGVDQLAQVEIANRLTNLASTILVVLHQAEPLSDKIDHHLVLQSGHLVFDQIAAAPTMLASNMTIPDEPSHLFTGMEPRWSF